jgi:hypothetical protein
MHGFANLLLLSGPSGGGKSTFVHLLKTGRLPEPMERSLPPRVAQWPVFDVTNHMRRKIESEGEAAAIAELGHPSDLILHYDITTVYRYGMSGYESDPALRLLRLARNIQVVFVCPDAGRLYAQFVDRDAARQARKSSAARAWNAHVLAPLRKARLRLSGQTLNGERALYSDPHWIAKCYRAWETYIVALAKVGAAQQILRVAPCEAQASEQAFCLVPEPGWPVALADDGNAH